MFNENKRGSFAKIRERRRYLGKNIKRWKMRDRKGKREAK
jgi:hypothetical protein